MIKEYIGEGADLLQATENAKEGLMQTLGLKNDDDIKIDIICDYKKKTLGLFGGSNAKVKAFIELPDPKPEKKKPAKKEKTAKPEKKVEKKAEKKDQEELNLLPAEQFQEGSNVARAASYIKTVMEKLGCENVAIKAAEIDGGVYLQLDGDKLGACIGRRGETLDALQYLTSLVANSANGSCKVPLNIGNYREKREQTLISLAKRVSSQVLSTGRSRTLEPMNPYERRIIHTAVQEIDGVVSNSVGEGAGRRVVISSENGERRSHHGGRGGRGGNSGVKPTAPVADPAREPKKDAPDLPLYGRIN